MHPIVKGDLRPTLLPGERIPLFDEPQPKGGTSFDHNGRADPEDWDHGKTHNRID